MSLNLAQWEKNTSKSKKMSAYCRISTGLDFRCKQSSIMANNINAIIEKDVACRQDIKSRF